MYLSREVKAWLVVFLLVCPGQIQVTRAQAPESSSGVSAKSSKRIGAVVDTLKDLLTTIENEEKAEAQNFKCFVQWCDTTIESKKGEIEEGTMQLENNKVAVQQHSAKIATTTYVLDKNAQELEEIQDALAQAEAIRTEENAKYS